MGLGVAIISFSPNTTIKSADVNTNFTNLNNATTFTGNSVSVSGAGSVGGFLTVSGGFAFTRAAGQQETGHYIINGDSYIDSGIVSTYLPSLSRNTTPVSVAVDTNDVGSFGCGSPITNRLTVGGFQVYVHSTGAQSTCGCGGNFTIQY